MRSDSAWRARTMPAPMLIPISAQHSPSTQPGSRDPLGRLRRHWDFLAVVLLVLATIPANWLSPRTLVVVTSPNLLDDSWVLDTSFKASRGIWLGRDVAFTYGPLFQWLSSAPARWMGVSMGAVYATANRLPLWCTFLFGYLTLRLLVPEQPAWKRFLLLLVLSAFWSPSDLRTSFAILLFALFLRGWYAAGERLPPAMLGAGAAFLCAAAFLYSADTGVYAVAAWVISCLGVMLEGRYGLQSLRRHAVALVTFVLAVIAVMMGVNATVAAPFDFRFWKTSLMIVSAYRWIEPSMMTKAGKIQLLTTLLVGLAILAVRGKIRTVRGTEITARTGFLVGAFTFAVLAMQSGLVRSDQGHLALATFPMIFFVGVVLFSFRSRAASAVGLAVALICSLWLALPNGRSWPAGISYRYAQWRAPILRCPAGATEFDRACFPADFTSLFEGAGSYLQEHSRPEQSIVLFPYQTIFGIASGRNVAGGLMQGYLASGPELSHLEIAGLEQATAPAGLYLPDGDLSQPIDGVSSFTRSPEVWFWFVKHYRSATQPASGVIALERDDAREARFSLEAHRLPLRGGGYVVRRRSSVIDLGAPEWPSDADFLRLSVTVRYGSWWKLRKPERLQLEITRADGSHGFRSFVLEPNVPSEVWFYPWNEADLAYYFEADDSNWRPGPRPAVTRLRLWATPLDWVSQQPESIELESADAVRVGMGR